MLLLWLHLFILSGVIYGKVQFSFQSQRKTMPKNAQSTTQLHSSHTLVDRDSSVDPFLLRDSCPQ